MRRMATLLAGLVVAGCAAAPVTSPPAALGADPVALVRPVDGAELRVGATYRFSDLLPGVLDVDLTVRSGSLFPASGSSFVYLSGEQLGETDVLTLLAADDVGLSSDPYQLDPPETEEEAGAQVLTPPVGTLLDALGAQPFLETVVPERPATVAGVSGVAVDVRGGPLPPATPPCLPGLPPCAHFLDLAGFGRLGIHTGQELRLTRLDHPAGPVLVVQDLGDARAQEVLDTLRFVERLHPAALAGSRPVPYSASPLGVGAGYGAVLADIGIGVGYVVPDADLVGLPPSGTSHAVVSTAVPRDLSTGSGRMGLRAGTEHLVGWVSAAADLLVAEPGIDPRAIGVASFARSRPLIDGGPGGPLDVLSAQPWAEVLDGPAATTVAGHPGRVLTLQLRDGSGSVPCVLDDPGRGRCAVLVHSRAMPSLWMLTDRTLRVAEVDVGSETMLVVTGADAVGEAWAGTLRLVELGP